MPADRTFMLILGLLAIALLIVMEPLANDLFANVEFESWELGEGIGLWDEPASVSSSKSGSQLVGADHSVWQSLRWPWRQRG